MALSRAPAVGSYVCMKTAQSMEPIWLQVTSVNDPLRKITGTVVADTIAQGASAGDPLTCDYNDVIGQRGATAPSAAKLPTASKPKRPSGGFGSLQERFED